MRKTKINYTKKTESGYEITVEVEGEEEFWEFELQIDKKKRRLGFFEGLIMLNNKLSQRYIPVANWNESGDEAQTTTLDEKIFAFVNEKLGVDLQAVAVEKAERDVARGKRK